MKLTVHFRAELEAIISAIVPLISSQGATVTPRALRPVIVDYLGLNENIPQGVINSNPPLIQKSSDKIAEVKNCISSRKASFDQLPEDLKNTLANSFLSTGRVVGQPISPAKSISYKLR